MQRPQKRSPFTMGKLRKRVEQFRNVLQAKARLTNAYQSLIADSDYLRIANTNQASREAELSLDCLLLLLVSLCEFQPFHSKGTRTNFLIQSATLATDSVGKQLRFVADINDESLFDEAKAVFTISDALQHRKQKDSAELLLAALDQAAKRTIGLYFTSPKLAEFVVGRVQQLNANSRQAEQGSFKRYLTSCRVLDPAAGAGVFLLEWLSTIRNSPLCELETVSTAVKNLSGIELHPGIATLCHCRIQRWCQSILHDKLTHRLNIHIGDALRLLPSVGEGDLLRRANVVIGNPPFNSLSNNSTPWIKNLLAGKIDGISYSEIEGQSISERKLWLHDDYIKFFRLAHHLVQSNEEGCIAFVSNRALIDNITFRGARWQLAQSFSNIEVHDHSEEEAEFDIATKVATLVLQASSGTNDCSQIAYTKSNRTAVFRPTAPNFFFKPATETSQEYREAIPITDAFITQGSAAITARDWFLIDIDRERLVSRIEEFCDLEITDQQIRRKYFNRCRSRRYVAGDTRSWNLKSAREQLQTLNWKSAIRLCCYRPLDRRWILWLPEMVDWPRMKLMESVQLQGNFSLVTRRQFPSDQPAAYFWIVDDITIDGIIRSDNRGNERLFPMNRLDDRGSTVSNLSDAFLARLESRWSLFPGLLAKLPNLKRAAFEYIYGLFNTSDYRMRYRDALSQGYPRIVFSKSERQTLEIIELGRSLIACQLSQSACESTISRLANESEPTPKPRYDATSQQVIVGQHHFKNVTLEDWQFRIGTHQVLKKWLDDRVGSPWTHEFAIDYQQVIETIQETRRLTSRNDHIQLA